MYTKDEVVRVCARNQGLVAEKLQGDPEKLQENHEKPEDIGGLRNEDKNAEKKIFESL